MKKIFMALLILGLAGTWAFAATDTAVNETKGSAKNEKVQPVAQTKVTKSKTTKKNKKSKSATETKKAEKEEESKETNKK